MEYKNEVILSGTGGQGLILAGVILAESAVRDGKNVVQTQSYGPEARGGSSRSEIIVADQEIDFPQVTRPDMVLAMSQEASDRYAGMVSAGGTLIVDSTYVKDIPTVSAKVFSLPITRLAREKLGREMVSNVVAIGIVVGITGLVSKQSVTAALLSHIPKGTESLNKEALDLGWQVANGKVD